MPPEDFRTPLFLFVVLINVLIQKQFLDFLWSTNFYSTGIEEMGISGFTTVINVCCVPEQTEGVIPDAECCKLLIPTLLDLRP